MEVVERRFFAALHARDQQPLDDDAEVDDDDSGWDRKGKYFKLVIVFIQSVVETGIQCGIQ